MNLPLHLHKRFLTARFGTLPKPPRLHLHSKASKMTHVQLFMDWDGTLTKNDTILVLSGIGYKVNKRNGTQLRPWDEIVQAYLEDLKAHTARYTPGKEQRKSIGEESRYLASLEQVERDSIKRIEKAGVFKGVTGADLEAGANEALGSGEVEMRPGWDKLFNLVADASAHGNSAVDLSIVTVNWSGTFIRSCLLSASRDLSFNPTPIENLIIWGNEIEGVRDNGNSARSTGNLASNLRIHTSTNKAELIKELITNGKNIASTSTRKCISVYVGDTATDFDALLLADIGICIRDEPLRGGQKELANMLERVGVASQPLGAAQWPQTQEEQSRRTTYWSRDLSEVAAFVSSKLLGS